MKKITRKKVDFSRLTKEQIADKIFLIYPQKDDGNGFGFIWTEEDPDNYKGIAEKNYDNLWFGVGFNVFKREEHDRVWECDEISLWDFDVYYATIAEIQLFKSVFKKNIEEIKRVRIEENIK